jgi:hypothetical protein
LGTLSVRSFCLYKSRSKKLLHYEFVFAGRCLRE